MKRDSKRRDDRRRDDRGGRDFGQRPPMHEAVCAECGQVCEVPFKPTGDKPVYCSNCFTARQGSQPRRDDRGGRDFGRPRFRERDRDRRMFSAVCDKCGKECQVPFQPTPGKPIYCDQCFERPGKGGERGGAPKGDQLASINAKLDKIMNALIAAKIIKPEKIAKVVKEVKPEAKKPATKKAVKKASKKKK
ncbi:MAG: hypothetical protein A2Y82_05450 [Candidatus Buchananbacteria bacterium RBG_13_36_9]|uniref:CxxC-x17-CxxC domain-containing protein n=1 Tax=Candidatus Buchananbacteria bacterium RBG_13_36_9 TaxID=1797530 RepID=A0A1G1XPI9_9BACT|nr:MAG: hypothetical protein A2Y82_05450 [Candidatus Buchananbacteria bacterium RBG_13_36_9]